MKTRIFSLVLALMTLSFVFTACTGTENSANAQIKGLMENVFNAPDDDLIDTYIDAFKDAVSSDGTLLTIESEKLEEKLRDKFGIFMTDKCLENFKAKFANLIYAPYIEYAGENQTAPERNTASSKLTDFNLEESGNTYYFSVKVECTDNDGEKHEVTIGGHAQLDDDELVSFVDIDSGYDEFCDAFLKS